MSVEGAREALLLVDTCGERGSVALVQHGRLQVEVTLPERAASAGLLAAVRQVLGAAHVALRDLRGIGVVNGPGSFTGLRVGLAVCKGLCEAGGVPLAAVSRLKVLADAAGLEEGFAVLRAGRDQVYVREVRTGCGICERLMDFSTLLEAARDQAVAYTEASLLPSLEVGHVRTRYVELSAKNALCETTECLANGGSDVGSVDANYVRDEDGIYARPKG